MDCVFPGLSAPGSRLPSVFPGALPARRHGPRPAGEDLPGPRDSDGEAVAGECGGGEAGRQGWGVGEGGWGGRQGGGGRDGEGIRRDREGSGGIERDAGS